mgnify:CR=1 FL=1
MHIGIIGLGKMGNNMRARLRKAGIEVTGYDPNPAVTDVASLAELAAALPAPRIVWVMVPSGKITDDVIHDVSDVLEPGDLVIDGMPVIDYAGGGSALAFVKTIDNMLALDAIRKAGKTAIYNLTPQQQGEWRAAMLPVHQQMEARIGKDVLEAINKEVAR